MNSLDNLQNRIAKNPSMQSKELSSIFPCRENRRDFPDFLKNWRKIVIFRISLKDRRHIRFYRDYVRKAGFQKSSINHGNYSFTVLL